MSHGSQIVVGVNGSEASRAAVRWAGAEAAARHAPVLLVHAWNDAPNTETAWLLLADSARRAETAVLAEAAELLRSVAPGVEQQTDLREGRADVVLVGASEHAALLVLGRHGGSDAWLGPVLGHVSVRSRCPVVAVPVAPRAAQGDVVVGVDCSPVSQEAVAFAFQQASLHGAPLVAVLAVPPPFDAYLPDEPELVRLRRTGRRHLAEALAGWSEQYPDVRVTETVSLDAPLSALQAAGAAAHLLVVGSHGRGAFLRTALGSVSSSLLRSARCPLVVVRHRAVDVEPPSTQDAPLLRPLAYY